MKSLKLNSFSKFRMEKKELRQIIGGNVCGCACSSNSEYSNGTANHAGGKHSPGLMTDQTIFLDEVVVTP